MISSAYGMTSTHDKVPRDGTAMQTDRPMREEHPRMTWQYIRSTCLPSFYSQPHKNKYSSLDSVSRPIASSSTLGTDLLFGPVSLLLGTHSSAREGGGGGWVCAQSRDLDPSRSC